MSQLSSLPVGGKLQEFWRVWDSHSVDPWVVQVLKEGYEVPFLARVPLSPVPQEFPSYLGNQDKFLALQKEVYSLRGKHAIEEVQDRSPGFYNHLFLVMKVSGDWRPVLDVSRLNGYVRKTKFSRTVLSAIPQRAWMISVDMQDAFFYVPIHQSSRKFLRFCFDGNVYQLRAMCFGLSTAPQVFTRVLVPLAKLTHLAGFRILLYLDDWLILAKSLDEMQRARQFVLNLARESGLMINFSKSNLVPVQPITYLGMTMDSTRL